MTVSVVFAADFSLDDPVGAGDYVTQSLRQFVRTTKHGVFSTDKSVLQPAFKSAAPRRLRQSGSITDD